MQVLDLLYDGTPESEARKAELLDLDVSAWAQRLKQSPEVAPPVDADRLMDIVTSCSYSEEFQDPAGMQVGLRSLLQRVPSAAHIQLAAMHVSTIFPTRPCFRSNFCSIPSHNACHALSRLDLAWQSDVYL